MPQPMPHAGAENMVWADRDRNIGYQAAVIAPHRPNFSGLVPVPGDGRYEWDGFLPIPELPHVLNPDKGFYNTSNDYQVPPGYAAYGGDAPGLDRSLSRPERGGSAGVGRANSPSPTWCSCRTATFPFRRAASCRCCAILPIDDPAARARGARLLHWNYVLDQDSVEAGIYEMFQRHLMRKCARPMVPAAARAYRRHAAHDAHHRVLDRAGRPLRSRSGQGPQRALGQKPRSRRWPN